MINELAKLCNESNPNKREDPIDIWQHLKANLQVVTQNVLTNVLKVNYKFWMTNKVLLFMDKQRKVSNKTTMIKEVTTNWVKKEYVED